jgi:hypothetical protein
MFVWYFQSSESPLVLCKHKPFSMQLNYPILELRNELLMALRKLFLVGMKAYIHIFIVIESRLATPILPGGPRAGV